VKIKGKRLKLKGEGSKVKKFEELKSQMENIEPS